MHQRHIKMKRGCKNKAWPQINPYSNNMDDNPNDPGPKLGGGLRLPNPPTLSPTRT